jgi:hypothetical protein
MGALWQSADIYSFKYPVNFMFSFPTNPKDMALRLLVDFSRIM